MKRLLVFSLLALPVAAQQVTIQNPSFETLNTLNANSYSGPWNSGPIPSWNCSGSNGSWQPNISNEFYSVPDGSTVVWVKGTCSQDVGVVAQANETYTFKAFVGRRVDGNDDDSTWNISLYAGNTLLCTNSGPINSIASGAWVQESVSCSAGSSPSGNVVVSISASAGTSFDNVSLSGLAASHQATLTWQDSLNPSGTTYNVYRSSGVTWNPVLLANVSALNYTDTTIVANQSYVYKVTAIVDGAESDGQFISVTLGVQ
jgi:hypothetical protein